MLARSTTTKLNFSRLKSAASWLTRRTAAKSFSVDLRRRTTQAEAPEAACPMRAATSALGPKRLYNFLESGLSADDRIHRSPFGID